MAALDGLALLAAALLAGIGVSKTGSGVRDMIRGSKGAPRTPKDNRCPPS